MRKIGNIYLVLIAFLLSVWFLPRLYYIITAKPYSTPFTLYSCIVKDFVSLEDRQGKDYVFKDTQGRTYSDSVLPFFYYRVLSSRNNTPELIAGNRFTGEQIERNNIIFSSTPKEVNAEKMNVYMLMESNPPRLELEDPEYALIMRKDKAKIIRISSNSDDSELEKEFAHVFDSVGFVFPSRIVSGNPSTHKSYDQGYVLTDADGALFHLKLYNGHPVMERIPVGGVDIEHIFVTEHENRASLAYLFDTSGRFYIVDSLRNVIKTDIIADVSSQEFLLVGDVLNYSVRVSDMKGESYWALDSHSYETIKTFSRSYPHDVVFDLPKYVFPFRLVLTSSLDSSVNPRIVNFSWIGLFVDIAVALIMFLLLHRKKRFS